MYPNLFPFWFTHCIVPSLFFLCVTISLPLVQLPQVPKISSRWFCSLHMVCTTSWVVMCLYGVDIHAWRRDGMCSYCAQTWTWGLYGSCDDLVLLVRYCGFSLSKIVYLTLLSYMCMAIVIVYTYTWMLFHTHTLMYTGTCTYANTSMCSHRHIYVHKYVSIHKHTPTHTCTLTLLNQLKRMHKHLHTQIWILISALTFM